MVDGPGILARRANFSRIKDAKLSYRFLSPPDAHTLTNHVLELPGRVSSAKINLRVEFLARDICNVQLVSVTSCYDRALIMYISNTKGSKQILISIN